ncbi:MAG: hypothetical protein EON58_07470 [Alphaproteobacteria bacterium]|nr:MAG: hypothetical protein EON58_07470 [Alphaproteobacteria bacterium]
MDSHILDLTPTDDCRVHPRHGRFCQREDLDLLIGEVGGLASPAPQQPLADLSGFLNRTVLSGPPRIVGLASRVLNGAHLAVKYTDIDGLVAGDLDKVMKWRRRYGIAPDQLLILHQESRDDLLERLYRATRKASFWFLLSLLGPCILIAPGYSVYDDGSMCRVHQKYNMARSARFVYEAASHGFDLVPALGWDRQSDLSQHSAWLRGSESKVIAINAQTGLRLIPDLVDGMLQIERDLDQQVEWIVFGGRKGVQRIVREGIDSQRIIHVASQPLRYAMFHRQLTKDRSTVDDTVESLVKTNSHIQERWHQQLLSQNR